MAGRQGAARTRRRRVGLVVAGATTLLVGAGMVTAISAQAAGCPVAYSGADPAPTSFVLNGGACTGSGLTAAPLTGSTSGPAGTPAPRAIQAAAPFKGVANSACDDLDRLKVTWWYNWYIDNGGCHKGGEYVPMISGKGDPVWQVDQIKNAGYKTFLGFNEPDHADQANMSVDKAIALWPKLTELVPGTQQQGYRLGSPAVSGDNGGRDWITAFMNQVQTKGLRVDFLTTHWYGWGLASCSAGGLENRIRDMEALPGNRPIWVTEFGCLNLNPQDPTAVAAVNRFYTDALAVFAAHPRVERYAWYPWAAPNDLVVGGGLTQLGNAFANAPGIRDGASGGVTLVNRATGKCLDVAQSSTDNGANVQQWSCHGGANQRWRIEPQGDGTSRIMNVGSNKALDVANCGTADGTNIEQFDWWNNNCQRWQLVDTGGGWVRLLNPSSGKVADVADCNVADGTNVRLWTWLNNDCQQWQAR